MILFVYVMIRDTRIKYLGEYMSTHILVELKLIVNVEYFTKGYRVGVV